MSELFDPLFGATAVSAALEDAAWVGALCEVESALARACAAAGAVSLGDALEVARACSELARTPPAELGRLAVPDGNPVVPLVRLLRARTPGDVVHLGATSQDVLDTAAMLVAGRALGVVVADLDVARTAAARLADEHAGTPMAGRTLLQRALPITFGALADTWAEGLGRAADALRSARDGLAVQLGGPVGRYAPRGEVDLGDAVRAAFAAELELVDPGRSWHTERSRIAALAGALGLAAGACAKVATDVVLLAQTELGEVREQHGGGSSSMPHKANPVAAITARAAAAQAPGLVATLLAAAPHELQRAAGAWHAEWPALTALLRCTGGAAARTAESLGGLVVDPAAMRAHLEVG